jgi:predicted DNA-binding protein (UPF0251 family)
LQKIKGELKVFNLGEFVSHIISTISRLIQWAKWGETHTGHLPTRSAHDCERALNTPLFGAGHIPDDVMRVEMAVCNLSFEEREAIIQRYQRKQTDEQIGRWLGVSRWTAKRRLKQAERAVHLDLSRDPSRSAPTSVPCRAQSIAVCAPSPA